MKITMPKLALLAFVAIPFSANASFEMMLIADNGSGLGQGHIKRFDPENGVYLGEFGRGFMGTITGVALDQANGKIYVAETTGSYAAINEFDYSTGARTRVLYNSSPFKFVGMFINAGELYAFDPTVGSASIFRFNLTTGASTILGGVSVTNLRDAAFVNGRVRVAGSAGVSSFLLSSLGSVTVDNAGDFSAVSEGRWLVSSGTVNGTLSARLIGSNIFYGSNVATTATGTKIAIGQSHDAVYTLDNPSANVYNIARNSNWNPYPTVQTSVLANGYLTNPVDMAIVVAPEPGSMIALGAGVLALVRRRKSSGTKA
jgi:hypothetical protein